MGEGHGGFELLTGGVDALHNLSEIVSALGAMLNPKCLRNCLGDRADDLTILGREDAGSDRESNEVREVVMRCFLGYDSNSDLITHASISHVYRTRNAPVIFFSNMKLTAIALLSSGERVAITWAASRCGSQSSKLSFSDLSYFYYMRRGIKKHGNACAP